MKAYAERERQTETDTHRYRQADRLTNIMLSYYDTCALSRVLAFIGDVDNYSGVLSIPSK